MQHPDRPRALVRTAILCTSTVLIATACAGPHPRIPEGHGGWSGSMDADVAAGVLVLVGEIRLCIDRPGEVTVTNVDFEHLDGDLRVEAFATKPLIHPHWPEEDWPEWVDPDWDSKDTRLWDVGFDPEAVGVDAVCYTEEDEKALARLTSPTERTTMLAESPPVVILGIQIAKETDATARAATIRVTYESGGRTHTHRIGYELILCGVGVDPDSEECDFRYGAPYGF
jgi:hypothetical protein